MTVRVGYVTVTVTFVFERFTGGARADANHPLMTHSWLWFWTNEGSPIQDVATRFRGWTLGVFSRVFMATNLGAYSDDDRLAPRMLSNLASTGTKQCLSLWKAVLRSQMRPKIGSGRLFRLSDI